MARRPTLTDVARAAGVGAATVDRVMNGRANVRETTARAVLDAARRLGYPLRAVPQHREPSPRPMVRFGFVLHKGAQEFYRNFARELETAVAARKDIDGHCTVRFSASQAPGDFIKEIKDLAATSDVLASSAINHPSLSEAVKDVTLSGIPVFALLNDFAQDLRRGYLGLNNLKVGRIAAWMIVTQVRDPGKLAIFVGGNRWHGHLLREAGFQSYLRDSARDFEMLDTIVNLETRRVTYEATLELLDRNPDLRGIYVAGGGMEGAIAAIREMRPPGKVALVVNELTEDSRKGLVDRYVSMVIATPLGDLCRALVDHMARAASGDATAGTGQHFLTPQLYVPESV